MQLFTKKITLLPLMAALLATVYGVGASAQEKRVVVFPFEGINIDAGVLEATTEVFRAELSAQEFIVLDLLAYQPPQPVVPASDVTTAQGTSTVDTPPSAPTPEPIREPTPQEIVQAMNADMYVEGKLVRLGSKMMLTIRMNDNTGRGVAAKKMEAVSETELNTVCARMAVAFKNDVSPEETRNLDNATTSETRNNSKRDRVRDYQGAFLAGGPLFDPLRPYGSLQGGYEAILEVRNFRAGANVGAGFVADRKTLGFSFLGNLFAGAYLNHESISPFIGGGAGAFLGYMKPEDNSYTDTGTVGFDLFPAFGVEFIRNSQLRMHVETRYHFLIDITGAFAHGPALQVGLSFI